MKPNVGDRDSVIRAMAGLALLLAAAGLLQWPLLSAAVLILAVLLLYTALTEWCPLYALLGISTAKRTRLHGGPARRAGG